MNGTRALAVLAVTASALLAGCAQVIRPPPVGVYDEPGRDAFAGLPPELATPNVDVLYVTDRVAEVDGYGNTTYGIGRSKSLAYGSAIVELGGGKTWEELVSWTLREPGSGGSLQSSLLSVEEKGRFPATPFLFDFGPDGSVTVTDEIQSEIDAANTQARADLRRRLALTGGGDVALFVHGIQTSFQGAMLDNARANHFLGRRVVSIAYTWPAGGGGLLSGYAYDRESGEFTIFHLKQVFEFLAAMPEVERVHVLAHSRGTDVVTTALRELIIAARAKGVDPRKHLKIENLLLVAADLDVDVAGQRIAGEALGAAIGRITIYASAGDRALSAAQGLFNSRARLGRVQPEALSPRQRQVIARATNTNFVIYAGALGGGFGHGYFRSTAVGADMILTVRDGRSPGAENGRPLEPIAPNFWRIGDDYMR